MKLSTSRIKAICEDKATMAAQLQQWGLIPATGTYCCPKCKTPMILGKYAKVIDGMTWRCPNKKYKKHANWAAEKCNTMVSLRAGTFFHRSRKPMSTLLSITNHYLRKANREFLSEEEEVDVSTGTRWTKKIRFALLDWMEKNPTRLGGPGKVVEIDESAFSRRKYHRGKRVKTVWVFGAVERESGKVCLAEVPDRSAATLIPLIKRWIEPGTTVISDRWKAYLTVGQNGFLHQTVNHSKTFKNPVTGAHTNNVEGGWMHAKASMPRAGRKRHLLPSELAKYCFIKACNIRKESPAVAFFRIAGQLYNPVV